MRFQLYILLLLFFMVSCQPEPYTPKPRGYYHIALPQHQYREFNDPSFPYHFEYPTYARIVRDTTFFGKKPESPYWINMDFPSLGGTIYISYKPIGAKYSLDHLLEDTHEMSFFHTKRADFINDTVFHNSHGVTGVTFTVGGNAASAYQFFATDSLHHFLRGALYFDVTPNADSLKPVVDFMRIDMDHLIGTMGWNY